MYKLSNQFQLLILVIFIGMLFSTALLSIGIFLFCLRGLFELKENNIQFNKSLISKSLFAIKNKGYWAFPLLFLYMLINPLGGSDHAYLIERLQIKLPFLLVPFFFLTYSDIDRKTISVLFHYLLILIIGIQLYVFIPFLNEPDTYRELLRTGQSISTPGNHIRFSLLTAFVILGNIHFVLAGQRSRFRFLNWFLVLISVIFMHILGVRTGLLILYTGVLTYGTYILLKRKKIKLLFLLISLLLLLPFLFYNFNNGFRNKIDYMKYDLQQYKEGKGQDYADSGRLVSLDCGYKLWRENLLLGVGMSNVRPSVESAINTSYPGYQSNLLPHNQFLFVLLSSGLIGFVIFLIGFLTPWIKGKLFDTPFLFMMFSCFLVCLMIDHLFEGTVGVTTYLLFMFIGVLDYRSN